MGTIQVPMPKDMKNQLKSASKELGLTMSAYIRLAVSERLQRQKEGKS